MPDKEVIDRLREMIKGLESREPHLPPPAAALEEMLPGDTEGGPDTGCRAGYRIPYASKAADIPFLRTDTREKKDYSVITTVYGEGATPELLPPPEGSLPGFQSLEPCLDTLENWVYLDIETTGLMGAATIAFLIGLGEWTGEGFRIDQYFLTDRQGEEAMLEAIGKVLEGRRVLVTFNGKAFDVPVIQSRYVMAAMRPPVPLASHLDFLSLTRRMGRRTNYGQSLKEAVRRFTGVVRSGDIPGHMIPALYFVYEREGDPSILLPVIKHNRLDVLDMACLTWVFGHILTAGARAGDPESLAGAGKLHLKRGNLELARKCLESACRDAPELGRTSVDTEASRLRLLGQVLRKQSDWEGAVSALEALVSTGCAKDEDYLSLARCYELGSGDLEKAMEVARQALLRHEIAMTEAPESLKSRIRRLERRLSKLSGSA